jgi:GAF domain-containing protein
MSTPLDVSRAGMDLLVEAGAVLATSLDPPTTMSQVARLTVPRLADLCVIDLQAADGSIREVAVASANPQLARDLEDLRERFPVDPDSEHPVARVIRSGAPLLLPEMSSSQLRSFAQGSEHAKFMLERDYRSAVVAPLPARGRTVGALSVLRLGEGTPYGEEDLALVSELARRAALAIDNARLFSELYDVEQRLQAVLGNLAEAITMVDESGRTVFANQAAADLLRVASPEEVTRAAPGALMERFLVIDESGRKLGPEDMPGRRLFAGEDSGPLLVRDIVRATGEERWLVVRASPVTDPASGRIVYVVNVFENITGVKRAELAETFMAEASRMLASSTDYATTLTRVARLAVPTVADWCAIDVLDDDGRLERVIHHHVNPDKLRALDELERDYRPSLEESVGIPEVLRLGRAVIYEEITREGLERYARDGRHLELLRALGLTSVIVVPMQGATRWPLGTITLASSETPRRLTRADMGLAVRLGRRAGTAVERARIYTERARIAHILQRALLPESLPEIAGAELHALYSAAGELNEVGGDLYDVFERDEHWMLVIGDVVGKGPRAAGVTALARHTLRAAALAGQSATGG